MPKFHIAIPPDGQKHELEEFEVYSRWQAGHFPEGSLYWTKGMARWEPLSGFIETIKPVPIPPAESVDAAVIAPAAIAPVDPHAVFNPYAAPAFTDEVPAEASVRPGHYVFYKDPRVLSHVLVGFLGLGLLVDVIAILGSSAQISLLSRPYSIADAEANDARQQVIGVANTVVYFSTVVIFGMWIYRVARNVRAFGVIDLEDKPGWAVGWYFVPIANLFRPYRAMKDIWKASANPADWSNQPGSPILVLWWTFWILSNVSSNIAVRIPRETISDLQSASFGDIIVSVISILVGIIAIVLVKTLTQRQAALVARSVD